MPLNANSPLYAVTRDIVNSAEGPNSLERVGTILREYIYRFHALNALVHEEEDDELLLHASPNLTIYHITLSPGVQYPPHNHLMDALIGIYRGEETNFVYPLSGKTIGAPERQDFIAPAIAHLAPHIVHSVANSGPIRSGALHVYFGDLPATSRQLWSLESNAAEAFHNERYLAGARTIQGAEGE